MVLLVWVYYSSQIFLLGAEFTKTYAHRHGSRIGEANPTNGEKPSQTHQGEATAERQNHTPATTPPRHLVPMDRGEPRYARSSSDGAALANFRIAAGVAATVGLLAGEILNELRQRRQRRPVKGSQRA
jgi:membrane protein